jgi:tetratricopeptide (TPR) repeat protein
MLLASAPANEFLSYEFFHALKDLDRSMALAHLDSALSSNPGFLLAALTRAYEYDQRQDCKEIIHLLERFKQETNDADLLLYLGSAYHHCGAVESARACYWKAINSQPNSEGYAALATIAQDVDKDNQMSESLFLRSLELEENCNVRLDLGWLYHKQGKHVMARTQFALCAERDKCCGSAIEALMLIGEWSLAERYYPSMSYCEHPEYILIALGIAIRVKSEGRSAQTIQDLIRDYENLYSNQPDESEALSFLREVLEQFGL